MRLTETHRFWSHVVKGPAADDCWLWTGAIADDGYGRFWTHDGVQQKAVRPQRYAYELVTGQDLTNDVMVLHSCDVPTCVHADVDPLVSHLREGSGRDNMLDRTQRNRHTNQWSSWRLGGLAREQRGQRSRALRAVILEHGWDPARMSAALGGVDQTHPRLF
jgi:hypothetical protein